jgi:hypothetical protein
MASPRRNHAGPFIFSASTGYWAGLMTAEVIMFAGTVIASKADTAPPKELFTDASLIKPMPFSAKPGPEVQLIAHELALLRGLAADRRQASWLAALRNATHVREREGRLALVQDPIEASVPQMPAAAFAQDDPEVLFIAQLARRVAEF